MMEPVTKCIAVMFVVVVCALSTGGQAQNSAPSDRLQTNRDIWVQPGDKTGDLTCLNCSIHIRGDVTGDVFAMHGNVIVEPGGQVVGDIASLLGNIQVENNGQVGGDVAALGGQLRRDPQAMIHGDQASFARFWIVLIALMPIAVLALIIALIVWLVQRRRRPVPRPA
jgi:hypothetical protein